MIIRLSTKKSILWRNYLQLAKAKEVQLYLWSVCLSVFFLFYNGGFVILPHSLLKIPRNFAIIILGISADSGGRGIEAWRQCLGRSASGLAGLFRESATRGNARVGDGHHARGAFAGVLLS